MSELRQTYPVKYGALSIDQRTDTAFDTGESLRYSYDDRDWNHDFTYYRAQPNEREEYKSFYHLNLDRFNLTPQVALSADGRTAIGQLVHQDKTASLVDLPLKRSFPRRVGGFLERQGWLEMPRVLDLPEPARAFTLGPKGELAVALGQNVYLKAGNKLEPWQTYRDTIKDIEYLSDGTLAVVTEKPGLGMDRFRFHLTSPGESEPTVVTPRALYPADYGSDVVARCEKLAFLKGSTFEQMERFLEHADWLATPTGAYKPHQFVGGKVVILDARPQVWNFDRASGKATPGPVLELPLEPLDFKKPLLALEGGFLTLPGESVPVWDQAGKLAIFLPGVTDVSVTPKGHLKFRDPERGEHTMAPSGIQAMKQQDWWRRATGARLLGREPGETSKTGLQLLNGQLRVGGTFLKVRGQVSFSLGR